MLIVRARGRRRWQLPGGRLDPGEAPREGALREVAEETGLEVTLESLAGAYLRDDGSYALVYLARASARAEPVGPINEIAGQRWVSQRKALRLLARSARRRMADALKQRAVPARQARRALARVRRSG